MKRNPFKRKPKPMRQISAKRAAQHASPEGAADMLYMETVKTLHCVACGAPPPSDAHHCKCKPPQQIAGIYDTLPIGRKSGARDTIPLCKMCHQDGPLSFHGHRTDWVKAYGPDYAFIPAIRASVAALLRQKGKTP